MRDSGPSVGGEVDAWCTRCKLELNHTVVAKVDGRVKRVQCLTCGGQHNYSPRSGRQTAAAERPSKKPVKRARKPLADDGRPARSYSVAETFAEEDVIQHPRYGRGLVVQTRGDKIDVRFTSGTRTLVHGRRIAD